MKWSAVNHDVVILLPFNLDAKTIATSIVVCRIEKPMVAVFKRNDNVNVDRWRINLEMIAKNTITAHWFTFDEEVYFIVWFALRLSLYTVYLVSKLASSRNVLYRIKIYTEFNLATWLGYGKFTELNIRFWFWIAIIYAIIERFLKII